MRQWLTNSRLSPTFSSRSKAAYTDTSFNLKSFLHIYHICHRNVYSSKLGLVDPWPYLVHFVVQFLRSSMQSLHGLSYFSCRLMNRCNSGRDVFSVAVFCLLPYLMCVCLFDVCVRAPYMSVAMFCLLLYLLCLCAGPILSHAPPAAAGRSQKWIIQRIYNCDLALTLVQCTPVPVPDRTVTYHTVRTLVPPGTHIALLAALSTEQWRSWSNLRTNPDTCIVPTLSFLLLWFPGRAGLVLPGCIDFNWIAAHKYWSDLRTNPFPIWAQILAPAAGCKMRCFLNHCLKKIHLAQLFM